MYVVGSYVIFFTVSLSVMAFITYKLQSGGQELLAQVIRDKHLINSINSLLLIGFCLINLGMICLLSQSWNSATNISSATEELAEKVGGALILQGITLCYALSVLGRVRGTASRNS
jgi:uncharacterized membrane protein